MELKDITSPELVEILLKRVKKLQDVNEYHPLYNRDIIETIDEILLELKKRVTNILKEIEKETE